MVSEPSSSATSSPKTLDPDSKMTDQTSSSIPPPVSYSSSHTNPVPQNFHTTTIKLNDFNFLVWKLRVVSTINGYDLHNYLLGGDLVPPRFLSQNDAASGKVNPTHLFWKKQDQLLMAWLVDSMTEGMLTHIVGCASSAEIWQTLEELFVSQTRAKERQLKTLLRSTKKGNMSMNDYLLEIKKIVDALTSIGAPVSRHDTIESILDGLPEEYEGFVTSISLHTTKYTVPEIHALLLAQETRLDKFKKNVEVVSANVAQTQDNAKSRNYNRSSSQNRGGSQNNRGSFRFPNHSSNNFQSRQGFQQGRGRGRINQWQGQRAQCQVCGKWGHIAVNCYNRYNQNFTEDALVQAQSQMPSSSTSAAPAQALLATPETLIDPDWYPDSGASNHLTNNADNIQQKQPYDGGETVRIGNGKGLEIHHIGHSSLLSSNSPVKLQKIMHVPTIKYNLLSVSKLTNDNNVFVEFHSDKFFVKSQDTNQILLKGRAKNGLYCFDDFQLLHHVSDPSAYIASTTLSSSSPIEFGLWHSRLGHPSSKIVTSILKSCNIECKLNKDVTTSVCHSCCLGKNHALPFPSSLTTYSKPLELIHTDLWGPAPMTSSRGFKYYMSFVDAYSKYTWLYLLPTKSSAVQASSSSPCPTCSSITNKTVSSVLPVLSTSVPHATISTNTSNIDPTPATHEFASISSPSSGNSLAQVLGTSIIFILVYVDDVILTGSSRADILKFIKDLQTQFSLRDLGELHYFLGVQVQKHENGSLLLTQSKYIADLLIKANMSNCKPTNTPMVAGLKLSKSGGADFEDPQLYRTIVGSLQYVLIIRHELSFSVNKVSQFMHSPQLQHWEAVKRILRPTYLRAIPIASRIHEVAESGKWVDLLIWGDPPIII
ncbi:Retrovirus-related Pol polyprotein from transposon TNT 1-94 [Senna tora]|uniref:Retrovirus-related Pol polyprotein from transposon TNT 1-94 n=1 Tax=Senna tora TaxID=362788 RepID=A0A834XA53_9FABA|nr:Retrovirus-related Pol polyprotein from transposon TNT 1-94 [Senna tora]